MRKSTAERFLEKVSPCPNTGCWLWASADATGGYGQFSIGVARKSARAHRVSYELFRGEIPEKKYVLHTCDVRCCVNPDHLFIGDDASNMADKVTRGRQAMGSAVRKSTLSDDDIREIRESRLFLRELAEKFPVSMATLSDIRRRKIWKHV